MSQTSTLLVTCLLGAAACAAACRERGAASGLIRTEGSGWLVRDPIHVGDREVAGYRQARPEGRVVEREFSLPEVPESPCIIMDLRDASASGEGRSPRGSENHVLEIDGEEAAILNDLVPDDRGVVYTAIVPVDPERLRPGVHRVTVRAGKKKGVHGDFEWGPARLAPGSRVRIQVRESGLPIPARIQVRDPGGARRISFGPSFSARGAGSVILAAAGEAIIRLPRDEAVEIWASRGIEYTAASISFTPRAAEETVTMDLHRVIDTTGWISADLHVHAEPSFDSRVSLRDRVISLLSEGVEAAVATDHNRLTDYGPVVREIQAEGRLRTIIGDEITTSGPPVGHFNVFPIRQDLPPPPFEGIPPWEIFRRARTEWGASIVQVNHPRRPISGYFSTFGFDPATGRAKDGYAADFDAVEILNPKGGWEDHPAVLRDWYAILRDGRRVTGTGNSDSHRIFFQDAGCPRNFIRMADDDPARAPIPAIIDAIRGGRIVVSSGPFISVSVNGKGIGDEVQVPAGEVRLDVAVDAAPWIEVDSVEVILSGTSIRQLPVKKGESVRRFHETIPVPVAEDGFLIVIARGKGYRAPVITNPRITPLAFTNPIWIHVTR